MHSTIILCNDLITFEDLNDKGMAKNHCLRSI